MKQIKILFFLLLSAAVALVAVQNADVLAPVLPLGLDWPGIPSIQFAVPIFVLIIMLFVAGFVLTGQSYLGEHVALRRSLAKVRKQITALERELQPEPEPEPVPEPKPDHGPEQALETESEPEHEPRQEPSALNQGPAAARIVFPEAPSQTLHIATESSMAISPSPADQEDKTGITSDDQPTSAGQEIRESRETKDVSGASEAPGVLAEKEVAETAGTGEPGEFDVSAMPADPSDPAQPSEAVGSGDAPSEKPAASSKPTRESRGGKPFNEDEELVARLPGPGWGAVFLLSAALALVISSGVYIVLNAQLLEVSAQLKDLHLQSGHLGSTQEEMGRIWKQERVAVREELQSLNQGRQQLQAEVENLDGRMVALQALPELVRKQSMAGMLRDAAGQTAFLGAQVETDAQRETLESIEEMLQSLARELEGEGR